MPTETPNFKEAILQLTPHTKAAAPNFTAMTAFFDKQEHHAISLPQLPGAPAGSLPVLIQHHVIKTVLQNPHSTPNDYAKLYTLITTHKAFANCPFPYDYPITTPAWSCDPNNMTCVSYFMLALSKCKLEHVIAFFKQQPSLLTQSFLVDKDEPHIYFILRSLLKTYGKKEMAAELWQELELESLGTIIPSKHYETITAGQYIIFNRCKSDMTSLTHLVTHFSQLFRLQAPVKLGAGKTMWDAACHHLMHHYSKTALNAFGDLGELMFYLLVKVSKILSIHSHNIMVVAQNFLREMSVLHDSDLIAVFSGELAAWKDIVFSMPWSYLGLDLNLSCYLLRCLHINRAINQIELLTLTAESFDLRRNSIPLVNPCPEGDGWQCIHFIIMEMTLNSPHAAYQISDYLGFDAPGIRGYQDRRTHIVTTIELVACHADQIFNADSTHCYTVLQFFKILTTTIQNPEIQPSQSLPLIATKALTAARQWEAYCELLVEAIGHTEHSSAAAVAEIRTSFDEALATAVGDYNPQALNYLCSILPKATSKDTFMPVKASVQIRIIDGLAEVCSDDAAIDCLCTLLSREEWYSVRHPHEVDSNHGLVEYTFCKLVEYRQPAAIITLLTSLEADDTIADLQWYITGQFASFMRPPHTTAYQNALADVLEHPDWPALPELDFGQTSAQPPASTSSVTICRTKRKSEKPRTTEVKAANAQDKTADKQLSVPLR